MKKIKKIISFVFLLGFFILINPVSAQCPNLTTVSGNSVNFVGELSDTGGDTNNDVWFQYGKTTSYGRTTNKRTLTSSGVYCITVSGLEPCTTYNYRAAASNSAGTSYGANNTFTTACDNYSVNIRANNSNGPITVPHNSSVNLSWTTSNFNNCTGPGGTSSDSVVINVSSQNNSSAFVINKWIRNTSDGTNFLKYVNAKPGDVLSFYIKVKAEQAVNNVVVKNILPGRISYKGGLTINGVVSSANVVNGINFGNMSAGEEKIIIFRGDVSAFETFVFGQTELISTVEVSSNSGSFSDVATVNVIKGAVAAATTGPTDVSTGLTNNIFFDSFVIPLLLSLLIIWLFKSHIIRLEEWLDKRKEQYQNYKLEKTFNLKIAEIKDKEIKNFFKK
jgi:hypothetical protein